jgi:ankyrin repeat protein
MNLKEACRKGDVNRVKELLQQGVDPTDSIIIASERGHANIVALLLQDGRSNPSAEDNMAIQLACVWGYADVVELLLKDGRVDPTANKNNSISHACSNGHTKVVKLLLRDGRADPTAGNNWDITMASRFGHIGVVKALLRDGRVEVNDWIISQAMTDEIREMLVSYKYRVDGKEYCRLKI